MRFKSLQVVFADSAYRIIMSCDCDVNVVATRTRTYVHVRTYTHVHTSRGCTHAHSGLYDVSAVAT